MAVLVVCEVWEVLLINLEEEILVSSHVSALFTSIPVFVALHVINSKLSTSTNFTNVCKIPTEIFIKLLEFTLSNCIVCFNTKFCKQWQGAVFGLLVSSVISNIYLEHWILSHSYISDINEMVVQVCWWCPQCHQERSSQQLQEHLNSIDLHMECTMELRNWWTPLPG